MFAIRSSDDRQLAAALIADDSTRGVELTSAGLAVEAVDFQRFTLLLPQAARTAGIRLWEVSPADESLESVFSYLVAS
jgi:ABC-2 type transport system ATP-binding protein